MADDAGTSQSQLTDALRERFTIERELGRGGMATVFLARDTRQARWVALKVLESALSAAVDSERFRREIRISAALQHPHILTVFDSGETNGCLWFTMAFVEGETLRARLEREGQLAVADALRITHQVAAALDFAHRHGVIHRDVKPENILLMGEDALVTDFGIARELAAATETSGYRTATLTVPGAAVGTPAYMSPEQASAERNVDPRTDVYSLGCVVYEMLAGEPPFTGPNTQSIIARRFSGEIPSLHALRPAIPTDADRVIRKALAPARADRFRAAGEFAAALEAALQQTDVAHGAGRLRWTAESVAAAVVGAIAVALLAAGWQRVGVALHLRDADAAPAVATADTTPLRRVAVLPFDNIGDPGDAYFADGITDAVRGKLVAIPGLRVTARTSSAQYAHTTKTPQQIGRELGVDYLITGTVRWARDAGRPSRVQVSPELIDVTTASTRWEEPFEGALTDVFRVQGDIATRAARALGVALGARETRELARAPTTSLAAYDAFLKGEGVSGSLGASDPPTLRRAIAYYEAAVALDSSFALAWSQLSRAHAVLYLNGTPTPAEAAAARAAATRALSAAPGSGAGHLAMGNYYLALAENAPALREFELGRRADPENADLLTQLARTEWSLGRTEASLVHLRQSQALDPRSIATARTLARNLLWLRRYPEALAATDAALTQAPSNLALLETKAMIFLARGDLARARTVLAPTPPGVDRKALVAYVANYWDLAWALPESDQRLLLTLRPAAFDADTGAWAFALAQAYRATGDSARMRAYADSAATAYATQLGQAPDDAQRHVLRGLNLAYAGHARDGIAEGELGAARLPLARDEYRGSYIQHQLARIYIAAGDDRRALDLLEPLLRVPYYVSPAWLRIDPNFTPLATGPERARFERLATPR